MNLTITLNLNAEQSASLTKRAQINEPPLTEQDYLLRSLNAEIASYVEADFNAASSRLVAAAKSLPYEERVNLIETIEQTIASKLP
jgi:hypothetical protein